MLPYAPTATLTCNYVDSIQADPREGMSSFGYDATESKGRRRPPSGINASEDAVLKQRGRDLISSGGRDVHRNFTIARWMIGKHLDYNTQTDFLSGAGSEFGSFDDDLEAWVKEKIRPAAFDIARRHGLDRFLRIAECRHLLDGDMGIMQLASGHVQAIEADRIRSPRENDEGWTNGVRTGPGGVALAYGIWDRGPRGRGYQWNRSVPASRFHLHGTFDRFDQVRGISPFAAALMPLQDVYEGIDYSLAKLKVEQLFALAIFRKTGRTGAPFSEEESTHGGGKRKRYEVDFGRGPIVLDLDDDDDAKFLKSDSPGANSREFLMAVIMIAMKTLDLPFSFFDESFTNFFGSRSAWLHYERSCKAKRDQIIELINWWFMWRLQLAVQDGEMRIPRGLSFRRPWWEWVPAGMPWWDPVKEINGDNQAVMAGWTDPETVCKKRNQGNWYKNIRTRARCEKFAQEQGVKVSWDMVPVQEVVAKDDEA